MIGRPGPGVRLARICTFALLLWAAIITPIAAVAAQATVSQEGHDGDRI